MGKTRSALARVMSWDTGWLNDVDSSANDYFFDGAVPFRCGSVRGMRDPLSVFLAEGRSGANSPAVDS